MHAWNFLRSTRQAGSKSRTFQYTDRKEGKVRIEDSFGDAFTSRTNPFFQHSIEQ